LVIVAFKVPEVLPENTIKTAVVPPIVNFPVGELMKVKDPETTDIV